MNQAQQIESELEQQCRRRCREQRKELPNEELSRDADIIIGPCKWWNRFWSDNK